MQDIPGDLDFVLIAVPAKFVVNVIEDAVKKNARTALIFSSGFSEIGGEGELYQKKIRENRQTKFPKNIFKHRKQALKMQIY